jgi:predicted glycogen debranching enzyme
MISYGAETCANLETASRHEWLETNGIGGFASSTLTGLNTRRYHGLLVAATQPPVGRHVLLSKLEETLTIGGQRFELSANAYPGVVHPQGFRYLTQFRLDPFPIFTYSIGDVRLEKSLFLVQGENTVVVRYSVSGVSKGADVKLELRPLIAFRDYHSLTHENGAINGDIRMTPESAAVTPYLGLPTLYIAHDAASVEKTGSWYRNFQYAAEQERGLDFAEDLFNPMVLRFDLDSGQHANVIASTEKQTVGQAADYRAAEIARRSAVRATAPSSDIFVETLTAAADQFIVARGPEESVIAGYHWFADWGRDTMISLPGLTLQTGRPEIARAILRTFARTVDKGMLPNRFPDAGETPEYNTVDATLWFFEAIRAYLAATSDLEFVRTKLYGVLVDIVAWHVRGTRYNIKVDASGLLNAGEPGVQLTWMDAKVGDWVVTPRIGKPVEIQALWYNALCIMEDLAERVGDETGRRRYSTMATLTKWSFNRRFWNEDAGCLYDVVNGGPPDPSIRPNQIFAVSLPHPLVGEDRAAKIVEVVEKHLLTPYGLRTLSPSDPNYRGRYTGNQTSRDGAYHQGTVWPWLIGPFITAYLRVYGRSEASMRQVRQWLEPLREHLFGPGVGQINEIFEGDATHRPVGCIAQAWSIAEILRVAVQELRVPASEVNPSLPATAKAVVPITDKQHLTHVKVSL